MPRKYRTLHLDHLESNTVDHWELPDSDRNMDDGEHENEATPPETREEILARKKHTFEDFLAAYCGEHERSLGGDVPILKLHGLSTRQTCVLLITASTCSHFLSATGESTQYRYCTTSQDPSIAIAIRTRQVSGDLQQEAIIEINSEQLTAPIIRHSVPKPTPTSLRATLSKVIGPIADDDAKIAANLDCVNTDNGVDCLTLKLAKDQIWIRPEYSSLTSPSIIARSLQNVIHDVKSITLIRRGEKGIVLLLLVDEFWDYLMHRCLQDGVYWAYGQPKRELTDLADIEDGQTVTAS